MSGTLTGSFPIGFRLAPLSGWAKDIQGVTTWASQNGFGALDLGLEGSEAAGVVLGSGLALGSVDLLEWKGMLSVDAATRRDAVARNTAYIEGYADAGPLNFFAVMLPEDPNAPPRNVFKAMVASFAELAPVLEACKGKLVIEGWPGPGALCCTPESYQAFFEACPSPVLGVNYDPSHLIRMGIDPLRFLREFMGRIHHVHAKDTEVFDDERYKYGTEQKPLLGTPPRYGGPFWRYTLPGHGVMRWKKAFEMLKDADYSGCVSIELEDHTVNGRQEREQAGLVASRQFLETC